MRLATFNILHGRSPGDDVVDLGRLDAAIRALDADVLGLQEVDHAQQRSNEADLTAVAAEAMGAREHRFVAALSGTPGATWSAATGDEQPDAAAYGIALLSRYPVRSWQVVRLPPLPGRAPWVWHGSRRLSLVHDEPRVAVSAVVETPLGDLTVATTHLSFLPGWNLVQLRQVVRALALEPGPRMLMGDLNMSLRTAARASGMAPVADTRTFPVDRPSRQIDHVLAAGLPATYAPIRASARDLGVSDHRALLVDVG